MNRPRITVCVCTRDRAPSLHQTLESLTRLAANGIGWEVLVVDNASRDETAQVAREFRTVLNLRMIAEPRAGLSHARNAALREAEGSHLIFVDDDVSVPGGWLRAYAEGFERHPNAAFFGGPIVPEAPGVPPDRIAVLKAVMPAVLAGLEPKVGECVLTRGSKLLPWGANMAFRRATLNGRSFDANLGRTPTDRYACGEETQLIKSLLADGYTGVWLPDAHLNHRVHSDRSTSVYFAKFCRGVGWYQGYERARNGVEDPAQFLDWARQDLRKRRWRYWKTPVWKPLSSRLETLRDYEIQRGLCTGFEETRNSHAKQVWATREEQGL